MEEQKLIDEIDKALGEKVRSGRTEHFQIQQVMEHFRRKVQGQNGQAQKTKKVEDN